MFGKPRILSLLPNSFYKFNKKMSTHVRPSIFTMFQSYHRGQLTRLFGFADVLPQMAICVLFTPATKTGESEYLQRHSHWTM